MTMRLPKPRFRLHKVRCPISTALVEQWWENVQETLQATNSVAELDAVICQAPTPWTEERWVEDREQRQVVLAKKLRSCLRLVFSVWLTRAKGKTVESKLLGMMQESCY